MLDTTLDRGHLQTLLDERALAHDAMDASKVQRIRADMERADARRLQPHYIESFFHEAFKTLGGSSKQREARRYEITHVPAPVRNRDRLIDLRPRALANLATDAGIAYIRSNNPAAARGMFSEAIRQVPLDVSTYGYLAMTYFPTSFAYSLRALRRQLHSRGVLPRGLVRR